MISVVGDIWGITGFDRHDFPVLLSIYLQPLIVGFLDNDLVFCCITLRRPLYAVCIITCYASKIIQTLSKIKMNFSTFFSKQARRPEGLFGRIVMSIVFDQGNTFLNNFVSDLMCVQIDDRIIEIGCGTGKLIYKMAQKMDKGLIEGVDFSRPMVSVARKRNKKNIAKGKVKILEGDFDKMPYEKEKFSKACSVNTLYFWPSPVYTANKIADILKPDGIFILAFEDIEQLKQRKLNQELFHLYSKDEVQDILINAGFSNEISIESRKKGKLVFHCVVAKK